MIRKIIRLSLVFLLAAGLTGCGTGNVLRGSVTMPEGNDTPADRIRIWVFQVGSNTEAMLYEVDVKLGFSIELTADGEYLIEGVVPGDPGFYTEQVRIVVENGKIRDNKKLDLQFELMNID